MESATEIRTSLSERGPQEGTILRREAKAHDRKKETGDLTGIFTTIEYLTFRYGDIRIGTRVAERTNP